MCLLWMCDMKQYYINNFIIFKQIKPLFIYSFQRAEPFFTWMKYNISYRYAFLSTIIRVLLIVLICRTIRYKHISTLGIYIHFFFKLPLYFQFTQKVALVNQVKY